MRKKGQIQMGESIAIIIIVLILIIFSFVFYSKIKASSIQEKGTIFEELDIVKLSQIVYSLPEIQCSFAEVPDYGCIDEIKVQILEEQIANSYTDNDKSLYFYYRQLFGTGKITIEKINLDKSLNTYNLYEATSASGNSRTTFLPVVLYHAISDSNSFGVIIIEKYTS